MSWLARLHCVVAASREKGWIELSRIQIQFSVSGKKQIPQFDGFRLDEFQKKQNVDDDDVYPRFFVTPWRKKDQKRRLTLKNYEHCWKNLLSDVECTGKILFEKYW